MPPNGTVLMPLIEVEGKIIKPQKNVLKYARDVIAKEGQARAYTMCETHRVQANRPLEDTEFICHICNQSCKSDYSNTVLCADCAWNNNKCPLCAVPSAGKNNVPMEPGQVRIEKKNENPTALCVIDECSHVAFQEETWRTVAATINGKVTQLVNPKAMKKLDQEEQEVVKGFVEARDKEGRARDAKLLEDTKLYINEQAAHISTMLEFMKKKLKRKVTSGVKWEATSRWKGSCLLH